MFDSLNSIIGIFVILNGTSYFVPTLYYKTVNNDCTIVALTIGNPPM